MKDLTVQSAIQGFKSSKGNIGTLIIFVETLTKGDRKDENIMFWSNNPDYVMESDQGWTYDEANDRVNAPVVTRQSQKKADLTIAHELGMDIRF